MILAKGEKVQWSMIDRLSEIGKVCGMEMNVGKKTEVMRISRQPSRVQIVTATEEGRILKLFLCHDNMMQSEHGK